MAKKRRKTLGVNFPSIYLKKGVNDTLVLHIDKRKFVINKNIAKQKLALFIKDKVGKMGFNPKKVAFKRVGKKPGRAPPKMVKPSQMRKGKRIPQPRQNNIDRAIEQVERQQQFYYNPYESELKDLTREGLIDFALKKGIKTAPRLTKMQIISELSKLKEVFKDEEISESKKQKLEFRRQAEKSPWFKYGIESLKKEAKKNRLQNYQNYSKDKLIVLLDSKGIKPEEEEVKRVKPVERRRPSIDIIEPIIENMKAPEIKDALKALGVKVMTSWRKPRLIEELKRARQGGKPEVKPTRHESVKEDPDLSPWSTGEDEEDDLKRPDYDGRNVKPQRHESVDSNAEIGTPQDEPDDEIDGKGAGSLKTANEGISNIDIDKIMSPYGDEWLGCYCCDEMDKLLSKVKPQSRGCAVFNTAKSDSEGEHWVCAFWDARDKPEASQSVEFYDSYGDDPDPMIDEGIKKIAEKLDGGKYLKYKINSVKFQGEKKGTGLDSGNCGYHCMRFLADRLRNKSFAECTGFDNSEKGEENVEKFKKINGLARIRGWGFLPSFARRDDSFANQIKNFIFFPAKELSNPFKNFMKKYGDYKILKASVRRQPISKAIDTLLNVISLGTWSQGKKELNYPDLMHLGILLSLKNPSGTATKTVVLEKLERPHFTESWKDDPNVEYYPVELNPKEPSLNQFVQKTIDKIGIHAFTQYGGFRGINCQNFIMDLLSANGGLTPGAKTFIYQPIEKILQRIPKWVSAISQSVTDFSARARQFFGVGKGLKGKGKKLTRKQEIRARIENLAKNFNSL